MKTFFKKLVDKIKNAAKKVKEFFSNHREDVIVGATVASMAVITGCYVHYSKQAIEIRRQSAEKESMAREEVLDAVRLKNKYQDIDACSYVRIFAESYPTKQADLDSTYYTDPELYVCPDTNRNYFDVQNVPISDMGVFGENFKNMVGGKVSNMADVFAYFKYD